MHLILLGRVALVAQRLIVVKLSRGRSVGLSVRTYVRRSVGWSDCPVHCGKTADRIRMPFGVIGRTGLGMRHTVGFGDRSTERGTFGGEFGARHCNQWGLYGVCVRQRRDAALIPNYFGQTCYTVAEIHISLSKVDSSRLASRSRVLKSVSRLTTI